MAFAALSSGMSDAAPRTHDPAPPRHDPRTEKELERLRSLAYLMDEAFRIPVINHRFGIDAVMGLVPGIGDVSGFALSGWLIWRARRLGAPNRLLARMATRSAVDLAVGSIPLIGDVADFVIKPNRRSMRMLERYLDERDAAGSERT